MFEKLWQNRSFLLLNVYLGDIFVDIWRLFTQACLSPWSANQNILLQLLSVPQGGRAGEVGADQPHHLCGSIFPTFMG